MENYIYLIGEEQSAIIPENREVLQFTEAKMGSIDTEELRLVVANVFGKGDFFPGPQEVVTSIIHELVRRWEPYQKKTISDSYCVLMTAFRLLDGEIEATPQAIIPTEGQSLSPGDDSSFYRLLLETLPTFQECFTHSAYAPDSKLVAIIKDSAVHHQQQ